MINSGQPGIKVLVNVATLLDPDTIEFATWLLPDNLYSKSVAFLKDKYRNVYKLLVKAKSSDEIVDVDCDKDKVNNKENLTSPMEMDI